MSESEMFEIFTRYPGRLSCLSSFEFTGTVVVVFTNDIVSLESKA